jgi:hypothetical protein
MHHFLCIFLKTVAIQGGLSCFRTIFMRKNRDTHNHFGIISSLRAFSGTAVTSFRTPAVSIHGTRQFRHFSGLSASNPEEDAQ